MNLAALAIADRGGRWQQGDIFPLQTDYKPMSDVRNRIAPQPELAQQRHDDTTRNRRSQGRFNFQYGQASGARLLSNHAHRCSLELHPLSPVSRNPGAIRGGLNARHAFNSMGAA